VAAGAVHRHPHVLCRPRQARARGPGRHRPARRLPRYLGPRRGMLDPKSLQGRARADLQSTWVAATQKEAMRAFEHFLSRYGTKYPKATEKLVKDRDALLAFFPSRRSTSRTCAPPTPSSRPSPPCGSAPAGLRPACRAPPSSASPSSSPRRGAAKTWRRIRVPEKVADLLGGKRYNDGISVPDDPPEEQREAA
jgi:putative transposase